MQDMLSTTFAALADPTRRAMLARLSEGPATVNELAAPFALGPRVIAFASDGTAYEVRPEAAPPLAALPTYTPPALATMAATSFAVTPGAATPVAATPIAVAPAATPTGAPVPTLGQTPTPEAILAASETAAQVDIEPNNDIHASAGVPPYAEWTSPIGTPRS